MREIARLPESERRELFRATAQAMHVFGKVMFRLLSLMAENECDRTSERTRSSLARKATITPSHPQRQGSAYLWR